VRELLTHNDIANEISMKRSLFGGSFLIVEGATDGRLYGKFVDREECEIIPAHSKDNVRISVRESMRRNDKKVLGIVDADLDPLKGISHKPPLFATDCRDIDTMMMKSAALDHVLMEYGDRNRVDTFVNRYGSVRDAVIQACYPLGLLMFASDRNDDDLSFRDLDHSLFIDRRSLRVNIDNMIGTVVGNSPHSRTDRRAAAAHLSKEMRYEHDPWDICRGHDMVSVLAMGLRDIFGGYNSKHIRTGELAGALRLAYGREDFRTTQLYGSVEGWCSSGGCRVWSQMSSL
jgi:hypothetical protein